MEAVVGHLEVDDHGKLISKYSGIFFLKVSWSYFSARGLYFNLLPSYVFVNISRWWVGAIRHGASSNDHTCMWLDLHQDVWVMY